MYCAHLHWPIVFEVQSTLTPVTVRRLHQQQNKNELQRVRMSDDKRGSKINLFRVPASLVPSIVRNHLNTHYPIMYVSAKHTLITLQCRCQELMSKKKF